jgi:hypothetical protein
MDAPPGLLPSWAGDSSGGEWQTGPGARHAGEWNACCQQYSLR